MYTRETRSFVWRRNSLLIPLPSPICYHPWYCVPSHCRSSTHSINNTKLARGSSCNVVGSVSNHKNQRFLEIRTSVLLLLRNPWVQMKVAYTFPRTCWISCQKIGIFIGQFSYVRSLLFRQIRNIYVVHGPSTRFRGTNVLWPSSLFFFIVI